MSLTLISPPAAEPVSLADLKEHLKISGNAEDALLAGLLVAARQTIEARFQIAVMPQAWRLGLDVAPDAPVILPLSPVLSVDAVGVRRGGVTEALAPASYDAQTGAVGRVRVTAPVGGDDPGALIISFTAGWADAAAVPDAMKLAIKILAAHLYENREGEPAGPIALNAILAPYRQVRL